MKELGELTNQHLQRDGDADDDKYDDVRNDEDEYDDNDEDQDNDDDFLFSCSQSAGNYYPGRPASGAGARCHAEGVGADMAQTVCGRLWLSSNPLLCPLTPLLTGFH